MLKRLIIFVIVIMMNTNVNAENIIDFIISNNPELQEIKSINKNILNMLKVEAKSNISYNQLTKESVSTLEQAKTRYDVGITASIPLISPSERIARKIEEAQKERTIRLEVAKLIETYKTEQKAIEEENRILISLHNELQWINKRVEAGVDTLKEYNQKLIDYLTKKKEHELKKEQILYTLEKILSYVSADKRKKLKEILNSHTRDKDG